MILTANIWLIKKWLNPFLSNMNLLGLIDSLNLSTHSLFSAIFQEKFNIILSNWDKNSPNKASFGFRRILDPFVRNMIDKFLKLYSFGENIGHWELWPQRDSHLFYSCLFKMLFHIRYNSMQKSKTTWFYSWKK